MEKEEFEIKLQKAKKLLESLNNPEITLNKSMEAYQEGIKTLKEASTMLEDAKLIYEELEEPDKEEI